MKHPQQSGRPDADQKLGEVLGQVSAVRRRLNSLVFQRAAFLIGAVVIASAALTQIAAYRLTPGYFLIVAAVLAGAVLFGIPLLLAPAIRGYTRNPRAAEIAEQRTGLKGRLSTVLSLSSRAHRYPLWPFLLEDTYSRREQFTPASVERRRFSKAIYFLAAALPLAAAALIVTISNPHLRLANIAPGEITVPLNDLEIRPSEPGDREGLQINADPATMARLQEKMANSTASNGSELPQSALGQVMKQARD